MLLQVLYGKIQLINNTYWPNIELWALEENIRARRFYEKIGFKHDNTVRIINMGKELKELRYIKV